MKKTILFCVLGPLGLGLAGCGDDGPRVYQIPKEEIEPVRTLFPQEVSEPAGVPGQALSLEWKVPDAWSETDLKPMRVASYSAAGGAVDISVVRLAGDAGGLAANVNRWRGQVGLPTQSEEEILSEAAEIEAGGLSVRWFELMGPELGTLVGLVPHADETWFFKLTGPVREAQAAKEEFVVWLESVRPGDRGADS